MKTIINTSLPIVYICSGKVEVLPFLDLSMKANVWGVHVAGLYFKRTCENKGNWYYARDIIANAVREGVVLPSCVQFQDAFKKKDAFNETVDILIKNGVNANYLEGEYWTANVKGDDHAYIVRMSDGLEFAYAKFCSSAKIRLALSE